MTRILIIDDDPKVREAIRLVLEDEGFEVTLAEDGNQAASAFRLQPADVVLCDMYMPGKEGIETIKELRYEFPGVKIIGISGSSGKDQALKLAQHLGASSVLPKPFSKAVLLTEIRRLLEMNDIEQRHLEQMKVRIGRLVCRVEDNPVELGALNTSEQLLVALVMNRFDWLPPEWNSMLKAIDHIGPPWVRAALDVQRDGWNQYRAGNPGAEDGS